MPWGCPGVAPAGALGVSWGRAHIHSNAHAYRPRLKVYLRKKSLHKGSLHKGSSRKDSLHKGSLRKASLQKGAVHKGPLRKDPLQEASLQKDSLQEGSFRQGSLRDGSLHKGSVSGGCRVSWGCLGGALCPGVVLAGALGVAWGRAPQDNPRTPLRTPPGGPQGKTLG